VADRVLDRFTEVGLVDDKAYAESYVAGRHAGRGLARRALAQELTRKGVAPETAAMALETVDPTTEEQTARALVTKRLPALAGLPADVAERRLVAGLARRGYGPGLAYRVVRDAMGDATDRPPPDADHP
jgi:regulatory protein